MGLEKSKGRCVVNAQKSKRRPGSGEWVEHATRVRSESKRGVRVWESLSTLQEHAPNPKGGEGVLGVLSTLQEHARNQKG